MQSSPQGSTTLEIYETLWREAAAAFARGKPQFDPCLPDKRNDLRRGVTVVLRPAPQVREKIKEFLTRLASVCPGQYFYPPESLHITVLSLVSGTEHWREQMPQLTACRAVIRDVLCRQPVFKIDFRGVTASPGGVMIQGFPADNGLEQLRNRLREALGQNGFGGRLDRRYKITAAHITAARFCQPPIDGLKLLAFLKEQRQFDFGQTTAQELELVLGDWYASADTLEILERYPLIERE